MKNAISPFGFMVRQLNKAIFDAKILMHRDGVGDRIIDLYRLPSGFFRKIDRIDGMLNAVAF
jgi:hypothetical protein